MTEGAVHPFACPPCGRRAEVTDILAWGNGAALLELQCEVDGVFEFPTLGDPKVVA